MFLKRKMNDSTNSYSDKIVQIKEKMGEADAPEEIRRKSVCMNEDIGSVLKEL